MASTYTTNLRLTKQGDGENPNSWGQILNDGVISLADQEHQEKDYHKDFRLHLNLAL